MWPDMMEQTMANNTEASGNSEAAGGDLAADLAALRHDVSQLAASMSTLVGHQTRAASDRVAGAVGEAGEKIAEQANRAAARVETITSEVGACVARNPLTSALIAFGIGLSVGILSRSRR
jgi:ElaB/YqjD/DUF883 family membrane-anchored ribosome-binding protein